MEWSELESIARTKAIDLGQDYISKLDFEVNEILKQGSGDYWLDLYSANKKFDHNKNGLIIAYLLGISNVDPIKESISHNIQYQADFPDIDIDFLPNIRDPIKDYITTKYGNDHVCSVGSWLTYKPRLALKDAARALGSPDEVLRDDQFLRNMESLLDSLPKEFDDYDRDKAESEFQPFKDFANKYPEFVDVAYRMVGRIKTQGKHAGGIIISSEPIGKHVPLTYDHKSGQHVSSWTEGFNQQLSKFGFVKFDLLGLKTMQDIFVASGYVKENKDIDIDWSWMHPKSGVLGRWRKDGGEWHDITMTDKKILDLCNCQKVETVFQFETDFAMSILQEVGIKSFWDIVAATSLGRPGPMEQIPNYVANRDDKHKRWKTGLPIKMAEILEMTHGVVIFQEQLQNIWTNLCGLTVPEAEKARKAVAKKKADELLKLEPRIINGLMRHADEKFARDWWEKMTKFGRYAFNLSHAAAYSVISWRCLFLKAYFPSEWWASVLSHAKPDRRAKYVGLARLEGIPFGTVDANSLKPDFHTKGDKILPGLSIMKGIGKKASENLAIIKNINCSNIDEFMDKYIVVNDDGKDKKLVNKSIMERLIKLGAFDSMHHNRKALWYYYVYKYTSGNEFRKRIIQKLTETFGWTQTAIEKEREKLISDWRRNQKDNGKNPPKKLSMWKPKVKEYNLKDFEILIKEDYTLDEFLNIEKKFYGFYWHSPMELYMCNDTTIEEAKITGLLECVIKDLKFDKSSKGSDYLRLTVTDGLEEVRLMVFNDQIMSAEPGLFADGSGIRVEAIWSDKFKSFSCKRGKQIVGLVRKDKYQKFINQDQDKDDIDEIIDLETENVNINSSDNIIEEVEEIESDN